METLTSQPFQASTQRLQMGAITFQIANPIESSIIETGKRSDGKVFLLENGMLSMTLTDGENKQLYI